MACSRGGVAVEVGTPSQFQQRIRTSETSVVDTSYLISRLEAELGKGVL